MANQNQKTKLQDLDIFSLLKLDHLSSDEKVKRLVQIQQIVFTDFVNIDLPEYLDDQTIQELDKLSHKEGVIPQEIEDFLRDKIKDYDLILAKKFLKFKKQLVRDNMQTRLNLNNQEREKIKEIQDSKEKSAVAKRLDKEKELLNNILSAIEKDEWQSAQELINSL